MRLLLLTSYCKEPGCTDDLPCLECLKMSNVIEVDQKHIKQVTSFGGWDYLRDCQRSGVVPAHGVPVRFITKNKPRPKCPRCSLPADTLRNNKGKFIGVSCFHCKFEGTKKDA